MPSSAVAVADDLVEDEDDLAEDEGEEEREEPGEPARGIATQEIVIAGSEDGKGKGRSFQASVLAYATCPMQAGTVGEFATVRPIFAMLGAGEAESLPVVRNLQRGRRAVMLGRTRGKGKDLFMEFLTSEGYEWHAQKHPEGVVWTVFRAALYRTDPGAIEEDVRFAIAPAASWLEPVDETTARWLADRHQAPEEKVDRWYREQYLKNRAAEYDRILAVCRYVTRVAPVFCASLFWRTPCPLVPDRRFYALLLASLLDAKHATLTGKPGCTYRDSDVRPWGTARFGYQEVGFEGAGLAPGLVCIVGHAALQAILAACVKVYDKDTRKKGRR